MHEDIWVDELPLCPISPCTPVDYEDFICLNDRCIVGAAAGRFWTYEIQCMCDEAWRGRPGMDYVSSLRTVLLKVLARNGRWPDRELNPGMSVVAMGQALRRSPEVDDIFAQISPLLFKIIIAVRGTRIVHLAKFGGRHDEVRLWMVRLNRMAWEFPIGSGGCCRRNYSDFGLKAIPGLVFGPVMNGYLEEKQTTIAVEDMGGGVETVSWEMGKWQVDNQPYIYYMFRSALKNSTMLPLIIWLSKEVEIFADHKWGPCRDNRPEQHDEKIDLYAFIMPPCTPHHFCCRIPYGGRGMWA